MTNEEQYLEMLKDAGVEHTRFADVLDDKPVRVIRTQPLNVEAFFTPEGRLIKMEPLYYRGARSTVEQAIKAERKRLAGIFQSIHRMRTETVLGNNPNARMDRVPLALDDLLLIAAQIERGD